MKPHRIDGVSLTFGVFFLVLAAWYLLARLVNVDLPMMGWSVAGGLIVLGLLGLVGALRSSRGAEPTAPAGTDVTAPAEGGQPVTDTDRAPIAERLRTALEEGRLTFTEYNERLQQAYTALTYEELDRVLAGLETPQARGGSSAADQF
jgi:hypothetical protein